MQPITVKFSFNPGDLIAALAGLHHLSTVTKRKILIYQRLNLPAFYYEGATHPTVDSEGQNVCMNEDVFYMMRPLLIGQHYIDGYEIWEGQKVDYDFDATRDSRVVPMPYGMIHSWNSAIFPELSCDLSTPWLRLTGFTSVTSGKILINRTHRYTNPYISYYFLKDHQDKLMFSGTAKEHEDFCKQWKLDIPRLIVNNFSILAASIYCCRAIVCNQSFNFHLADAMKSKRILEMCAPFPNTFVTGANGHQFYHQKALEFYFNKLL